MNIYIVSFFDGFESYAIEGVYQTIENAKTHIDKIEFNNEMYSIEVWVINTKKELEIIRYGKEVATRKKLSLVREITAGA